MPAALLVRANDAARMLGISRSTLYARVQAGRCPEPIRWEGCTVWRVRDLENFVDQLADQVADQPEGETQQSNKNMVVMG
ncbi:helix-turn-helix transcriptional regulator [Roseovarius nitratireducens]|uniref:helix-turn-helix transcriptional regulator n=1 Tax=Roseovarius nitratireducens TaxID=2044597 RepID=UPI000CE2603F|nr:helix-turn-helix domain-containing protein [Roseovarius nitratireducens]